MRAIMHVLMHSLAHFAVPGCWAAGWRRANLLSVMQQPGAEGADQQAQGYCGASTAAVSIRILLELTTANIAAVAAPLWSAYMAGIAPAC